MLRRLSVLSVVLLGMAAVLAVLPAGPGSLSRRPDPGVRQRLAESVAVLKREGYVADAWDDGGTLVCPLLLDMHGLSHMVILLAIPGQPCLFPLG